MKKIFYTNTYIYLSVFRILISIHIFKKYLFFFFNKDILTSKTFVDPISSDKLLAILSITQVFVQENIYFILNIILILSILFAFGIFRYFTPLLLLLSIELLQRTYIFLPNGGDNLLKFLLFYMIFTNCYKYFTFYKAKDVKKYTTIGCFINQLGVLLIKAHLCLIYLTSAIFKLNTKVWFSGTATYYTLQLERFQGTKFNIALSKNGTFITLSTYATLIWEFLFPFFAWSKNLKFYIFGSGIIIHLGIYIFMMIHDFEILFIMCYGFFISDEEWTKFHRSFIRFSNFTKEKFSSFYTNTLYKNEKNSIS